MNTTIRKRFVHESGPNRETNNNRDKAIAQGSCKRAKWVSCGSVDTKNRTINLRFKTEAGEYISLDVPLRDANQISFGIREWLEYHTPEFLAAHLDGENAFPDTHEFVDSAVLGTVKQEEAEWQKAYLAKQENPAPKFIVEKGTARRV